MIIKFKEDINKFIFLCLKIGFIFILFIIVISEIADRIYLPFARWSQRFERQVSKDNVISGSYCVVQDYWGDSVGVNSPDKLMSIHDAYGFIKVIGYKQSEIRLTMQLMQGRDVQHNRWMLCWITENEYKYLKPNKESALTSDTVGLKSHGYN